MTIAIHKQVEVYYTAKAARYGATPAGVDWNSTASQQLRFRQLLRVCPERPPFSLLDFGCGYGALYGWLREQGIVCDYRGFDLSPRMIAMAQELFAGKEFCRFFHDESQLTPADVCVASGIFNVKQDCPIEEWKAYVFGTIERLATLGKGGFAFNLLTSYSDADKMRPDLFYGDPCAFFDYCKRRHGRNVALLHDYDLYEFTILVRK
jgi:SAM-dependent methyltransferase